MLAAFVGVQETILQSLYNLSDDAVEFQILDRLSFMRFLKLGLGDRVPDSKRIWLLRDQLATAGLMGQLFKQFDRYLTINGYSARKGQIVDASIVSISGISNIPEKQMLEKESRYKKEIPH